MVRRRGGDDSFRQIKGTASRTCPGPVRECPARKKELGSNRCSCSLIRHFPDVPSKTTQPGASLVGGMKSVDAPHRHSDYSVREISLVFPCLGSTTGTIHEPRPPPVDRECENAGAFKLRKKENV